MMAVRLRRLPSLSKRKALAYVLSAGIFALAIWAALRLSFPPDPYVLRGHSPAAAPTPVEVETGRDTITINRGKESRTFRFRETRDGAVVAEEVPEEG